VKAHLECSMLRREIRARRNCTSTVRGAIPQFAGDFVVTFVFEAAEQ
jgi:hypothetical protein